MLLRNRTRPGIVGLLALGVLLSAAGPSPATTLILQGTADLLEHSDTVLTGTVVSIEARMHPEHQFIYTYVTLEVEEVLKGSAAVQGTTVTLEELGGEVNGVIHHVPGVPRFDVGQRVLNFAENHVGGYLRTYGMIQGNFTFETDAKSGEQILARPKEWTDTYLASTGTALDLVPARTDGAYRAEPLIQAIREWMEVH